MVSKTSYKCSFLCQWFFSTSGQLPPSVRVDQNRLLVRKVDETVNTTFVCEVKNSLGSGKKELAATVIGE